MAYKQIRPIIVSEGGTGNTTLTIHSVLLGNSTSAITQLANGTTGQVLKAVTGLDPAWGQVTLTTDVTGTLPVANGGTGNTTFTAYSLIAAGTTATGPFQNVVGVGTAGQILVSAGAGALPAWTTAGAATVSITGDTGGAIVSNTFTFTGGTTGLSFGGAGTTETLTFAGITANGGAVALGTDNAGNAITIGTGTVARNIIIGTSAAAHVISIGVNNGASSLGLNAGTGDMRLISGDEITLDAAGLLELNSTGAAISIGNDANNFAVNIGTAGTRTVTVGSTTSTSATTIQNGSGAMAITSTNGTITMNSGTGTLAIGNDATAQTIGFATGAGAKLVTVGTTNGAASLALKYGTADFTLASATGTVMSALDTGEITYPLQSAFAAYLSAPTSSDKTGDGTTYTVICDTELFDQNADYNNSTGTFTAPVTGKYFFEQTINLNNIGLQNWYISTMTTTARNFTSTYGAFVAGGLAGNFAIPASYFTNMTAGDTVTWKIYSSTNGAGTKTVGILGAATDPYTYVSGYLVC